MAQLQWRNLETPDEVIRSPKIVQNIAELGDVTVAKTTIEPGWRWSVDPQPVVGGEWCQVRHVGSVVAGALGVAFPDGTETILRPGDV